MLWFLSMAHKRGFLVDSYRDEAVGVLAKNSSGELAITRVILRPEAHFGGDRQPTTEDVLTMHHESHKQCFIARSVKTDVRCEPVGIGGASTN